MKTETINLTAFRIITPSDGEKYRLLLGSIEVEAKTLKFGVIKLFNKAGIIPGGTHGVEYQLIDIIKGCPASRQRDWLLSILDNQKFKELPPLPTKPYHKPLERQESQTTDVKEVKQPTPVIVTDSQHPVKVPYRRRGQTTIYDPIIDAAIEKGGSYRAIAADLLNQGISICHMSIKRRKEEKNDAYS